MDRKLLKAKAKHAFAANLNDSLLCVGEMLLQSDVVCLQSLDKRRLADQLPFYLCSLTLKHKLY